MLANIKKGQLSKRKYIIHEKKKICESILQILWDEGFILGYTLKSDDSKFLKIFLKYLNEKPAINSIKVISKPSRRVFYTIKQIWKLDSSKSFIIFSTNKGLKSIIECKKLKIGGEPFIIIN
jgi:small subunit ribosomal protein S8